MPPASHPERVLRAFSVPSVLIRQALPGEKEWRPRTLLRDS